MKRGGGESYSCGLCLSYLTRLLSRFLHELVGFNILLTNSDKFCFLALHTAVRRCVLSREFEEEYAQLAAQFYPTYLSACNMNIIPPKPTILRRLSQFVHNQMEAVGSTNASCISVAISLQLYLSTYGCDSTVRIGFRKQDDKLFSHAWLLLDSGEIIDSFKKHSAMTPIADYTIEKWVADWAHHQKCSG